MMMVLCRVCCNDCSKTIIIIFGKRLMIAAIQQILRNSLRRLPYQLWNVSKYGTCADAAITGIMPTPLSELQSNEQYYSAVTIGDCDLKGLSGHITCFKNLDILIGLDSLGNFIPDLSPVLGPSSMTPAESISEIMVGDKQMNYMATPQSDVEILGEHTCSGPKVPKNRLLRGQRLKARVLHLIILQMNRGVHI